MWIFLDLSVIFIIIISAIVSARRGFVRTAVEAVGFVAALLIAFSFSTPLAEATYNRVLEPKIVQTATDTTDQTVNSTADAIWESIPEVLTKNADKFGFSKDKIISVVEQNTADDLKVVVENTARSVFKPIIVKLLSTLYSFIITIVLLFVVKYLARILNKIFSFSVVGKLNRTLGGIVGIVKGSVFAVLYCVVITFIVSLTTGGFLIFTHDNIAGSYLFGYVANLFNIV